MSFFRKLKATLGFRLNESVELTLIKDVDDVDKIRRQEAKFVSNKGDEWRYFLSDPMLKKCVITLAGQSVLSCGFDTVLESTQPLKEGESEAFFKRWGYVKEYVDQINKRLNMDEVLYSACIKLCIYGKAAYEIILDDKGKPVRLKVLPVYNDEKTGVQPVFNRQDALTGYVLQVNKDDPLKYKVDEVLYFTNNEINGKEQGISDVEALIIDCINLAGLRRDLTLIRRRVFNPYVIASVDTSDKIFSPEDSETASQSITRQLEKLAVGIDSGSNVVTNNKVELQMVQLKIVLTEVATLIRELEDKIISYFGIPRFLVNRPDVNRATAEMEMLAFVEGTVAIKQRYLKREMEKFYDLLVKQIIGVMQRVEDGEVLPVRVKHVWKPCETGNIKEKVDAAAVLYGNGLGLLGDYPEVALKLVGLNTGDAIECLTKSSKPEQDV